MQHIIETSVDYVMQAYIASSPRHPKWSEIEFAAVVGWQNYQRWTKDQKVDRDPRLTDEFSKWHFKTPIGAAEVLKELRALPQHYHLRVARISRTVDTLVFAGAYIEPGTIVDGPGDIKASAREPFWKVSQKEIDRIVPADKIKDIKYV